MNLALRQFVMLIAKDLRLEARTRQTIGLIVTLGILIVVVLGLGLRSDSATVSGYSATAILWVAYLFGGVLAFEKTMAIERGDDALAGLLLAPLDRGIIYAAKLVSNLVLMIALALIVTPVAIVMFRFDLSAAPLQFVIVIVLSMVGYAALGTLFSAVVTSSKLQGGLLAMIIFPFTLPVILASSIALSNLFEHGESILGPPLGLIIAFDVIFVVASWLVFELVLEA